MRSRIDVPSRNSLEMRRLALQHLLQEVVGDLGLIARQSGGPRAGIVTTAQRERRQPDRGGPPLRPLAQRLGRLLGQLQSSAGGNLTGLLRVQGQERGPDLDQISARTQTAQRHPRIAARDQHQLRPGWNPVDEERENRTALPAVITSTSSSTRTNGSRSPRAAARSGRTTASILGAGPDNSSSSSPSTGPVRSRAAATRASSTTGSLSPGPSCTQPPALGSSSLHCATSVDFP